MSTSAMAAHPPAVVQQIRIQRAPRTSLAIPRSPPSGLGAVEHLAPQPLRPDPLEDVRDVLRPSLLEGPAISPIIRHQLAQESHWIVDGRHTGIQPPPPAQDSTDGREAQCAPHQQTRQARNQTEAPRVGWQAPQGDHPAYRAQPPAGKPLKHYCSGAGTWTRVQKRLDKRGARIQPLSAGVLRVSWRYSVHFYGVAGRVGGRWMPAGVKGMVVGWLRVRPLRLCLGSSVRWSS